MAQPHTLTMQPNLYQLLQESIHDADTQDRFYGMVQTEPEPEIKLIQAILWEAIERLDDAAYMYKPSIAKAVRWVESDSEDGVFTFVSVCEALGVSATLMRKKLRLKYHQAWEMGYIVRSLYHYKIDSTATKLRLPLAEVVRVARLCLTEYTFTRKLPFELRAEYPYQTDPVDEGQGSMAHGQVEPVSHPVTMETIKENP